MGYYIDCNNNKGKAQEIISTLGAIQVSTSEAEMIIREELGGAIICVVDNGPFEAAAYCYSLSEFKQFNRPDDRRAKTWLFVKDDDKVKRLTGYNL